MPNQFEISSCREVNAKLIRAALTPPKNLKEPSPRDKVIDVLNRMAKVAKPNDEAGRVLDVLARVATQSWVDGTLDVLVERSETNATVIDILAYDGLNYQRPLPSVLFEVPHAEFVEWVARFSGQLSPLTIVDDEPGIRLRLVATGQRELPDYHPEDDDEKTVKIARSELPKEAYRKSSAAHRAPTLRMRRKQTPPPFSAPGHEPPKKNEPT